MRLGVKTGVSFVYNIVGFMRSSDKGLTSFGGRLNGFNERSQLLCDEKRM